MEETILETRSRRTCALCKRSVIWARIKAPPRSGGRAYVPFPVERCAPGEGDIALGLPLFRFPDGEALLAEYVNNGTTYRSHRDHCPALPRPTQPKTPAPASTTSPRQVSFSAANFGGKKARKPTTQTRRRRTR